MNFSVWMILGLVIVVLGLLILGFRFIVQRKRKNAPIMIQLKGLRKVMKKPESFLYVDLKIVNKKDEPIKIIEIQQRHILGPWKKFVLEDPYRNRKLSFFECREYFPKKKVVKSKGELIRNYRMVIIPELENKKLFLQYLVLMEGGKSYTSKGIYISMSELRN